MNKKAKTFLSVIILSLLVILTFSVFVVVGGESPEEQEPIITRTSTSDTSCINVPETRQIIKENVCLDWDERDWEEINCGQYNNYFKPNCNQFTKDWETINCEQYNLARNRTNCSALSDTPRDRMNCIKDETCALNGNTCYDKCAGDCHLEENVGETDFICVNNDYSNDCNSIDRCSWDTDVCSEEIYDYLNDEIGCLNSNCLWENNYCSDDEGNTTYCAGGFGQVIRNEIINNRQCTKTLYSGAMNIEHNGEYIPFEDFIEVSETKSGEFLIEDLNGKKCTIGMNYVKSNQLSSAQPLIIINKSRGSWYFTTDARESVNSMGYDLDCKDFELSYSNEALNIGSNIKIDFKQARTEQNISTTYDDKTNKLTFEVEGGKTGDLKFIDPTITLQTADTENLKDARVEKEFPTSNYGHGDYALVFAYINRLLGPNSLARTYITFNISSLNGNSYNITNANLSFYYRVGGEGGGSNVDISVHHVYDGWKNSSGQGNELLEGELTWNNQPCGINFNNDTNCNLTAENTITEEFEEGNWYSWNVTNILTKDINRLNVSFVLKNVSSTGTDGDFWDNKNKANPPKLAIDYIYTTDQNISGCTTLDSSGIIYYLNQSIINSSTSNCMDITANNVVLDCQGHTIDGNDAADYGIRIDGALGAEILNTTIKNCILTDWDSDAVLVDRATDSNIDNVTISSCPNSGISLSVLANNWTLTNINISEVGSGSTDEGIAIANADYVTIENVTISGGSGSGNGIRIFSSNNPSITNVNISSLNGNNLMPFDYSGGDTCDATFTNNFYDDKVVYFSNETVTLQHWNNNFSQIILCDADNSVLNNITFDNADSVGGITFTGCDRCNLTNSNIDRAGIAVVLHGNSDIIGNAGHIYNNNFSETADSGYVVLTSGAGRPDDWQIYNNTIYNDNLLANAPRLYFSSDDRALVYNNKFHEFSDMVINFGSSANDGKVYNNLFNSSQDTGSDEIIDTIDANNYFNTTKQSGTRIYGVGSYIGGNYYTNSSGTGYSDTCADSNKDGFCDTEYTGSGNAVDYLPLSSNGSYIEVITPTSGQTFIEDQPTTYFNITTGLTAMDSCHWSEDSGVTNYTMTNISVYNWTLSNTSMVDGAHTIEYYCNLSDGSWDISQPITFDVDSVNVTVCRDLTVDDRIYKVRNNLASTTTCLDFTARITENVILEGNNYNISFGSSDTTSEGINIFNGNNLTIQNFNQIVGSTDAFREAIDFDGTLGTNSISVINISNAYAWKGLSISGHNINFTNVNGSQFSLVGADNNTFIDCKTTNAILQGDSLNAMFINTTIDSESVSGNLTRKWYFQTQVNDSNGNLQSAQVESYDNDSNLEFAELTGADGTIDRQELIEYINTGGTKAYHNPYTINVSKATYITNSTSYNLTIEQNIFHYVTLELSNKAPTMNLSTPTNNSYLNSLTNDMTCNSTDSNGNLKNVTLFTWTGGVQESSNTKSINGSTNETTWTSFGFTGENIYEWNCYTCDTDHKCAWNLNNWTLTIDTTDPNATHIFPNATQNTTLTQNLTVNLTDTRSLKNATLNIYNSTGDLYNQTTVSYAEGVTSVVVGIVHTFVEGIYEWFWKVFDRAGNSFQSTNQTITIDQTAPTVTITYPTNGNSYTFSNISINWTVTDNVIGVDSCWYTNDTGVTNYTVTCSDNVTWQNLSDDIYTYVVYSNDSLNNLGSDSVTFTISTTAPAINLNAPSDGQWFSNGTNIYFNFTATDSNGLGTCELWGNWTGVWHNNYTWVSPTNATMNWTQVNITGDGEYNFGVWCNDTLGNGAFSTNRTFNLDETFPNVTNSHHSPTTVYTETTTTIYGNITDTNLDAVWIEINYSGSYQNHTVTNVLGDQYYYILHHSEIDNFENISWYWHANDSANNVNSSSLASFFVTNRNPYNVNITSPINGSFINTAWIWINFTATDADADTLNFTLYNSTDGTTFSLYDSTNLTYLNFSGCNSTEGAIHYLYLTVNDTELQNSSITNTTFIIDKTNPGLTLSTNAPPTSPTPICSIVNIELNYSVSDTNIDYCSFNVTLGDTLSTPNTIISGCSNTTFNVSFDNTVQQLNFQVVDKAGNSNSTTRLIYLNTGGSICSPPVTPTTVGGGGTTIEKVLVVAVIKPIDSELFLSNLQRAIIYKEISEVQQEVFGAFSISLSDDDLSLLGTRLSDKGINMDDEELTLWVENFEQGELDEVFLSKENFDNFNLVLATGTYCGDGVCQKEGNDLGTKEDFFNCQQDCPPPNVDSATLNCIDFNPDTPCIWGDLPFQYVGLFFGMGLLIIGFSTKLDKRTKRQVPLYKYYAVKLKGKKK